MQMRLAFEKIFLDPGKTFSVAAVVRVVDGMVWATTSGNLDDVSLQAGQEHAIQSRGLTVIESAARSIVELLPPTTDIRQSMRSICSDPDPTLVPAIQVNLGTAIVVMVVIGLPVVASHRFTLRRREHAGNARCRGARASDPSRGAEHQQIESEG